jgi:hypothetical protein
MVSYDQNGPTAKYKLEKCYSVDCYTTAIKLIEIMWQRKSAFDQKC